MADRPGKKTHGRKVDSPLDIPMYDVVAYQEANSQRELDNSGGYCNPGYSRDSSNPGYTSVHNATKNRESVYTEPTPAVSADMVALKNSKSLYTEPTLAVSADTGNQIEKVALKNSKEEIEKHTGQSKELVCSMAVFVVVVLLVNVGCLVYLFLQVFSLRDELASSSTADRLGEIESDSMQQQLNNSISELREELAGFNLIGKNRLTELQTGQDVKIQSLNTSIADQDIKIQSLSTSIGDILPAGLYSSCAALPPSFSSGYYWVRASNGSAVLVYCDITRSCDGVTGGWRRVANLDMTNSSHQCPSGLRQRTDSNQRTCVRNFDPAGCSSVTIPSAAVEYSRLCGRIIGYQVGTPEPFFVLGGTSVIDTYYVNGVSLTHGNPRQHIWTFAAGPDEVSSVHYCPCASSGVPMHPPPAFVGNDYFCDTGSSGTYQSGVFYGDDPLWDGAGCGPPNVCCSFNNPPWFHKQLPQPTTDDIEMRVCRDQASANEDVAIEIVEIYVQ